MPAVMVLRSITNPVPDSPGRWLAGEIVTIGEQDQFWGFKEMPLIEIGTRPISQINGGNPNNIPLYAHVITAGAGTITQGNQPDFDVEAGTSLVWQFGNVFVNYGVRADTTPGNFYHVRVEDRTVEEVNLYLESYNKKLEYETLLFDPDTDNRRFQTTNIRVSASGNNGFTEQGIQDVITAWNAEDPLTLEQPNPNPITLFSTDNLTTFTCDGIMPVEVFDAWKQTTQELALADYYARRRWYINQAGLNALAANDGTLSGPVSIINPYLNDGLLE